MSLTAHMHWIGQQDLQAETGRVSKKSLQNDGVLIVMISETDHWQGRSCPLALGSSDPDEFQHIL